MYDLLNCIPENKLVMQNVKDEVDSSIEYPAVLVPRRIQTIEQRVQTNLFAIEVVDLLATAQRFQIAFTKFIPAYHHAFNHQCRVAEYGFVKFIELLEAIPHVVEVNSSEILNGCFNVVLLSYYITSPRCMKRMENGT